MAVLKYWDGNQYVPVMSVGGTGGGGAEEVAISTDAPVDPLELWVSLNEQPTGSKKYSALIGDGASTSIAVAHNLGVEEVVVAFYTASTKQLVFADVTITDVNTITAGFQAAPATNGIKVVVMA